MESLIYLLIVGLIAGWLASMVMKGGFGLVGDLIVGVVGAVLGDWVFRTLKIHLAAGLLGTILTATIGAILLIALIRVVKRA
jgi:uncharacterized membrane protein YeaQ/YmgE (transglycosylase-associated protein family)